MSSYTAIAREGGVRSREGGRAGGPSRWRMGCALPTTGVHHRVTESRTAASICGNGVVFMHHDPLAVHLAQAHGQAKPEADSLPALFRAGAPHQASGKR